MVESRSPVAGLIPAHAGKMAWMLVGGRGIRAHPRSRGENLYMPRVNFSTPGSSPLTRGKPMVPAANRLASGLIPAHAGKTCSTAMCGIAFRAHPRSRGENLIGVAADLSAQGSSPLTRGKRH